VLIAKQHVGEEPGLLARDFALAEHAQARTAPDGNGH